MDKEEIADALRTAHDYLWSAREQLRDAADGVGEPEGGPCRLIAANLGSTILQVDGILSIYDQSQ